MRILGLDVGDKRIGVAISDPEEVIARPIEIITRNGDDTAIESIVRIVKQYDVKRVIVGLPFSLDGSLGRQAEKVKNFVEKLSQKTTATIEFMDERLSTVATERLLIEARSKKAQKSPRDDAVAAFILQGHLDSLKVSRQ
jgi:putative Holliday junction resolvase